MAPAPVAINVPGPSAPPAAIYVCPAPGIKKRRIDIPSSSSVPHPSPAASISLTETPMRKDTPSSSSSAAPCQPSFSASSLPAGAVKHIKELDDYTDYCLDKIAVLENNNRKGQSELDKVTSDMLANDKELDQLRLEHGSRDQRPHSY